MKKINTPPINYENIKKNIYHKPIGIALLTTLSTFFIKKVSADQTLANPLGNINTFQTLIGKVILGLLGIIGSLSLIMFIYGGFLWIMSGGNEDNVKKGKETLKWAVLGLVVVFASYSILNFILDVLIQ
ncbi:MAG TPA: pilin [bacterium]|jgi:uncharacterized membrane protein YwzB|nr:pilin [bacterium]HOG38595.1 pilin [bacterium]